MKKLILALCVSSMFGCAQLEALRQSQAISYVSKEISVYDSETIGDDMARFLASQLPAAKTTLYIEPTNTLVRQVLVGELTDMGFGIVETKGGEGAAIALQYFVTPLDNGVLVRMRYNDTISSRYYIRQTDGGLFPSNKVAVREAAK